METVEQSLETIRLQNAIRRLIRKIDKRLIPFIMLLELSSFSCQIIIGRYVYVLLILFKNVPFI
jgi:hypothetical protein